MYTPGRRKLINSGCDIFEQRIRELFKSNFKKAICENLDLQNISTIQYWQEVYSLNMMNILCNNLEVPTSFHVKPTLKVKSAKIAWNTPFFWVLPSQTPVEWALSPWDRCSDLPASPSECAALWTCWRSPVLFWWHGRLGSQGEAKWHLCTLWQSCGAVGQVGEGKTGKRAIATNHPHSWGSDQ